MSGPDRTPVLLLDGFNLAFRSFYAVPELTRSDGFPTNAIHGWTKSLWRLEDLYPGSDLVAFFDSGGDPRREALLPGYKATRTEMPEELGRQIPVIMDLTLLMGIPVVAREGVEADDLIASAAEYFRLRGQDALIVSADKDMAQCVREGVSQLLPPPTANPRLGWRTMDEAAVLDRYGVRPDQIPDYLALIGDTSDNIPGLTGVGPKTAASWLQAYGNLEGVITNSGRLKPKRFQSIVNGEADRLRVNLDLTRLKTDHEPTWGPVPGQAEKLAALFEEYEMKKSAEEAIKRAKE